MTELLSKTKFFKKAKEKKFLFTLLKLQVIVLNSTKNLHGYTLQRISCLLQMHKHFKNEMIYWNLL